MKTTKNNNQTAPDLESAVSILASRVRLLDLALNGASQNGGNENG